MTNVSVSTKRAACAVCRRLVSAARLFSLGSLAFPGHAIDVAVGSERGPISTFHERRFSVFTQRGPMACQWRWWIYVRLRQGLRCECRRKRNAESNHKSVCDKHSLAPDFSSDSIARPSHELGPSAAVAMTGNVPVKSGCRPVCATLLRFALKHGSGDILPWTLGRQPRNTVSLSFVPSEIEDQP
jgi:hypothetical protein